MRGVAGRRLRQAAQPEDSAFMPAADAVFLSILYVAMEDLQETIMDLEAEDRPAQDPTATRCFGPDHPQPAPHGQASDGRSLEEFDESSVGTREIGPLLRGGTDAGREGGVVRRSWQCPNPPHPFIPPAARPATMSRWTVSVNTRTGAVIRSAAAAKGPQLVCSKLIMLNTATGRV